MTTDAIVSIFLLGCVIILLVITALLWSGTVGKPGAEGARGPAGPGG